MITSNVICRVFQIKVGSNTATAFTIEDGNRQYVVTAAHVVDGLKAPHSVEIFANNRWVSLLLTLTGICSVSDIAVFAPPFQLSPTFPLPATAEGLSFGQDVYFLGFPYGMTSHSGSLNGGIPFPLVKKACFSAYTREENGGRIFVLDGHNNPGFSGGPAVFRKGGQSGSEFQVLGVVSGYRFAPEPVYDGETQTPATVKVNTGIIFCYDIRHAVDLIRKNPNGALPS